MIFLTESQMERSDPGSTWVNPDGSRNEVGAIGKSDAQAAAIIDNTPQKMLANDVQTSTPENEVLAKAVVDQFQRQGAQSSDVVVDSEALTRSVQNIEHATNKSLGDISQEGIQFEKAKNAAVQEAHASGQEFDYRAFLEAYRSFQKGHIAQGLPESHVSNVPEDLDQERRVAEGMQPTVSSFHTVAMDVDSEGDEPEDSISRQETMVALDDGGKYVDYWRNEGEEAEEYVDQTRKSITAALDDLDQFFVGEDSMLKAKMTVRNMEISDLKRIHDRVTDQLKRDPENKELQSKYDAVDNEIRRRHEHRSHEPPKHIAARGKYDSTSKAKKLTPAKARQILRDKQVRGYRLTDQQRKYFGAVSSGTARKSLSKAGPFIGPRGDHDHLLNKSEAHRVLEDWLEKATGAGLPTGDHSSLKKPKSQTQGGSADGGNLDGVGKTTGEIPAAPGPGQDSAGQISGTGGMVRRDRLSEDDVDDEKQMKPHQKPIERSVRKSTFPADQRASVSREHAIAVSRIRTRNEASVRVPMDSEVADLVKGDGFYYGDDPALTQPRGLIQQTKPCRQCGERMAKSLTACPSCGDGQVQHRHLPQVVADPHPHQALIRRPSGGGDVRVCAPPRPISVFGQTSGDTE